MTFVCRSRHYDVLLLCLGETCSVHELVASCGYSTIVRFEKIITVHLNKVTAVQLAKVQYLSLQL